jgi:hypothetical protein
MLKGTGKCEPAFGKREKCLKRKPGDSRVEFFFSEFGEKNHCKKSPHFAGKNVIFLFYINYLRLIGWGARDRT